MQYVLTQEEMDRLVPKTDLINAIKAISCMRRIIVPVGQCVHDKDGPPYCDDCPLSHISNQKLEFTRELSMQMCNLQRRYSK